MGLTPADPTDDERKAAFVAELTALSRRTGVIVEGCGDCGSPWLTIAEDDISAEVGYTYDENRGGPLLEWEDDVEEPVAPVAGLLSKRPEVQR